MEHEEIPVDGPHSLDKISDAVLSAVGGSIWWTKAGDRFYGIWILRGPTLSNFKHPWIMG